MDDLTFEYPVHYVYGVKHLYLGFVQLLGNLVPQFKHLRGKLMLHFFDMYYGQCLQSSILTQREKNLIVDVFDMVATVNDSSQTS